MVAAGVAARTTELAVAAVALAAAAAGGRPSSTRAIFSSWASRAACSYPALISASRRARATSFTCRRSPAACSCASRSSAEVERLAAWNWRSWATRAISSSRSSAW